MVARQHDIILFGDDVIVAGGLRFAGGTPWGSRKLAGGRPRRMKSPLSVSWWETAWTGADRHRISRQVIETAVMDDGSRPVIVVMHDAPHPCDLPHAHRSGRSVGRSASDLSVLDDVGQVALWVHGHLYQTARHDRPGDTRIVRYAAGPGCFVNGQLSEEFVPRCSDREAMSRVSSLRE